MQVFQSIFLPRRSLGALSSRPAPIRRARTRRRPPRRLLKTIARIELLILDDWGLANVTAEQGRDLLEILDDRHGRGPTIVTSQLGLKHWHDMIANPTVADAI